MNDVLGYLLMVVGALAVLAGILYWAPRPSPLDRPDRGTLYPHPLFNCAACGAELVPQMHAVAGVIRNQGGRRIVESVESAQLTLYCPNGHDTVVAAGGPFGVVKDVRVDPGGRILAEIDLAPGDRLPRRLGKIVTTHQVR